MEPYLSSSFITPSSSSSHPADHLRSFADIPDKYKVLFHAFPHFNTVQSQVLDDLLYSNDSIVVAAPTGSGKTVLFEIAIVKLLMELESSNGEKAFKMVYISPVKALCRERYDDWSRRFSVVGVSCVEVTGDDGDYFNLQPHHLIITTPEKFDSLTRRWRDNASLVNMIKLVMIDEVHLLNDNKRGPVLEAIVARLKTVAVSLKSVGQLRFLAVSATIFNVEDLAVWLGGDVPARCHKFGNEVRPVLLHKVVKGYNAANNQNAFLFDIQLSYKLKPIIMDYAQGRPTLVFCSTRKSVLQTTQILSQQLTFHFSETQSARLVDTARELNDIKLKELLLHGVGYHHAGVSTNDRHHVQALFSRGCLPVLVATSTLAMGVNLPAHLVIVKGTEQFIAGSVMEYTESSILQMIGRAGRPQFDKTATAVIMTKYAMVGKYERLMDSKEIVESSLHLHLPEHINSEVVLFTITDISVAMEWIRHTFLYVRAMTNPKHYGVDASAGVKKVEKYLESICLKEINALKKADLIEMSGNGMDISPTANGRLMSHYYLSFRTFKVFHQLDNNRSMSDLLTALCEAEEFSEVQLRVNERKILNELNKSKHRECIRFPMVGKIKTRAMKVNCLIQACLGSLQIQDPALQQEALRVVRIAERLLKCLAELLSKRTCFETVLNVTLLAKALCARMWENVPFMCRQLDRIGPVLGGMLAACGKTDFHAIEMSNPRDLERILNRAPPFGNYLIDMVVHLPKYSVNVVAVRLNLETYETNIKVELSNADMVAERSTAGNSHWLTLLVGDTDNRLLCRKRLSDASLLSKPFHTKVLSHFPDLPHKVLVHLLSEQWVGIDVSTSVVIIDRPVEAPQVVPRVPRARKKKDPPADDSQRSCSDYWKEASTGKVTRDFKFFRDYSNLSNSYKPVALKRTLACHSDKEVTTASEKKFGRISSQYKQITEVCFDVDIEIEDGKENFHETEEPTAPEESADLYYTHDGAGGQVNIDTYQVQESSIIQEEVLSSSNIKLTLRSEGLGFISKECVHDYTKETSVNGGGNVAFSANKANILLQSIIPNSPKTAKETPFFSFDSEQQAAVQCDVFSCSEPRDVSFDPISVYPIDVINKSQEMWSEQRQGNGKGDSPTRLPSREQKRYDSEGKLGGSDCTLAGFPSTQTSNLNWTDIMNRLKMVKSQSLSQTPAVAVDCLAKPNVRTASNDISLQGGAPSCITLKYDNPHPMLHLW